MVDAVPICMNPSQGQIQGPTPRQDVLDLDAPEFPHRRRDSDDVEREVLRDRQTDLSSRSEQVRDHLPNGQIPFVLSVVSQLSPRIAGGLKRVSSSWATGAQSE